MDLPALLAGPILRRTDGGRICVWLATGKPCVASVEIFREPGGAQGSSALGSADGESVRLGRNLYVHLVILDAPAGGWPTDELLAYDVLLQDEGAALRLDELGLLEGDRSIAYPGLSLPTFFIRAATPDLRLLHGSCRLLHGKGEDAFLAADEVLAQTARNVAERPCVLLLTGDQIYGDEVAGPLVRHLVKLGRELIGDHDESSVPGVPPLSQLPVYGRAELASEVAKLTSGRADNHIMSFGEFAAMYVTAWNEATWPARWPGAAEALPEPGATRKLRRRYEDELACLERARIAIPAARRVMANTPTYMVFDDHDVTDDWNITREWCERVHGSAAGRRIVANALASFWAFQGWGNDPDASDETLKKTIGDYLSSDVHDAGDYENALWDFDRWSFIVPTSPPTIALDTRTQRSFDSHRGGARLIRESELKRVTRLIQECEPSPGDPLILVSPVPVFGLEIQERRQKFLVGKVGPYEIDFEAWHSNLQGFVDFMRWLIEDIGLDSCVLLSGDVHYGLNVDASFETPTGKLSFVQLVSSSFKHSGALSRAGIELLGRLVTKHHERVGWDRPPPLGVPRGPAKRAIARAANTDEWSEEAPVFLAPKRARHMDIEQPPDYRERRSYVRPEGPNASMLIGENNVGLVTIRRDEVVHRILGRTKGETVPRTATLRL